MTAAAVRDAFVFDLVRGATTQSEAVEKVLAGLASRVRYDPDRVRRQEPGAVFREKRANCVGFSELAVDLLRRAGIRARTVQESSRAGRARPLTTRSSVGRTTDGLRSTTWTGAMSSPIRVHRSTESTPGISRSGNVPT